MCLCKQCEWTLPVIEKAILWRLPGGFFRFCSLACSSPCSQHSPPKHLKLVWSMHQVSVPKSIQDFKSPQPSQFPYPDSEQP